MAGTGKNANPIDGYAATWMAIGCLNEDSVAMGGAPVPIPDFTNGRWLQREPDVPYWYTPRNSRT